MRKIITLLFCISLTNLSIAQKCIFNLDETDSNTGLQKKHIMTSINNQFIFWTNKDGAEYKIGLEITLPELQKESIRKGDTLTILLTSSETIIAIADDKYLPLGKADELIEATNYFPFYTVAPADWLKLCATTIQFIKVNFGQEFVGYEVNEAKAKKIKQAAACVK